MSLAGRRRRTRGVVWRTGLMVSACIQFGTQIVCLLAFRHLPPPSFGIKSFRIRMFYSSLGVCFSTSHACLNNHHLCFYCPAVFTVAICQENISTYITEYPCRRARRLPYLSEGNSDNFSHGTSIFIHSGSGILSPTTTINYNQCQADYLL